MFPGPWRPSDKKLNLFPGTSLEGAPASRTGGELQARHVIHAVGPFYEDDPARAPGLLASALEMKAKKGVLPRL